MRFSLLKLFRRKAFDVDVTVHYGSLKQDLQTVKIIYELDGTATKEKHFNYLDHEPSDHLRHQVQLPRGDYSVIIEMRYPGCAPHSAVGDEKHQPDVEILRLYRTLSLPGNTKIIFFLDQDEHS